MENTSTEWQYKKLEFDRILESIIHYSLGDTAKKRILGFSPEISKERVTFKHSVLTELKKYFINEESFGINALFDFGDSLKKAAKKVVLDGGSLFELSYSVKNYFSAARKIQPEKYPVLKGLFSVEKLEKTFYLDVIKHITREGYVQSGASRELSDIRERLASIEDRIKKATNDFYREAKNLGYLAEDIISVRDGFSCVAVKSGSKNRLEGIVMDSSTTGQTVFIAPKKAVELHNELVGTRQEEHEEIRRILGGFTEDAAAESGALSTINEELIEFDVFYSVARYCSENGYRSPVIISEKKIRVINGRHPLLGKDAVPLNVTIGDGYRILVITGPNTGGKTVVLKTLGIFVLMVQCGIGIPAEELSEFPLFTGIFVDIGDEQSIEQSLSTFSSHITRIIHTLKHANINSLVLLDEIGAGTDPVEGSALGISILKKLKKIRSISVVTTHYSALKHFATDENEIKNASMEFDIANLKPTYRLLVGVPGSSHALEISKRLGMPDEILDEAYKNLDDEYVDTEKIIGKLESERKSIEERNSILLEQQDIIRKKEEELLAVKSGYEDKLKQLKKLEKSKSFEFLNEARKEFENLIMELRTNKASKESILDGKKFFEKISEKIKSDDDDDTRTAGKKTGSGMHEFKSGDDIIVISNGMKGSIIGVSNNEDEFIVQVGIVRLNLKADEMEYAGPKKQKAEFSGNTIVNYVPSEAGMTLDLRGTRYDEAEKLLDKFVENAMANKISSIKIIHGKGSGAIRKCIQEYFDHSPFIVGYEYETDPNYGTNYGITVAQIR
jgi:DNA mismatch repair protein MutS2